MCVYIYIYIYIYIYETVELESYLGDRQGQERIDSDVKTVYDRLGSETFICSVLTLNSLHPKM